MYAKSFNLRQCRMDLGMTQPALAEKLGVPQSLISSMERNVTRVAEKYIVQLEQLFGINRERYMEEVVNKVSFYNRCNNGPQSGSYNHIETVSLDVIAQFSKAQDFYISQIQTLNTRISELEATNKDLNAQTAQCLREIADYRVKLAER